MQFARILLPLLLLAIVTACGGGPAEKPPYPGIKLGQEYEINGRWYKPHYDKDYDEIGMASWYGPGFNGGKTANGERFDQYDLTAAHRTLPLPCIVRVTNLDNGKSAIIRVNDRGPFARNRILDVSKAAASKLGMIGKGSAKVRVQFLEQETHEYVENLQKGGQTYAINHLKGVNSDAAGQREEVRQAQLEKEPEMVPAAQPAPAQAEDSEEAEDAGERVPAPHSIQENNLPTLMPVATAQPAQPWSAPAPRAPLAPAQPNVFSVAGDAYAPETSGKTIAPPVTGQSGGFFVQAGTFSIQANANKLLGRLADVGQAQVSEITVNQKTLYRVLVGPYNIRADAKNMLSKLASIGIPDAKIIHN